MFLKHGVFSATSGLLSSFQGDLEIVLYSWQGSRDASRFEEGDPESRSGCHCYIEIPIDSQGESGIICCGSMQLCIPREMSKGVKPLVEMRRGTRALSRVFTGHSDIPSCCERKHGIPFESQQGNQSLPRLRETRCPFELRQQTQGLSYIPIAERSLLLRCLWKVGIPLEWKPGNQLSSRADLGYMEHFCVAAVTTGSL